VIAGPSSCDVQSGNALLQIPSAWSTVVPATSTIFQDGGRRHLEFFKMTFWTPDDTYISRIYKRTKFGANQLRIGRDMPFCVFSKMAAAAIFNFQSDILDP